MTAKERFDQFRDEFLKFDRVENKLSSRPDLHAFILLDRVCPISTNDDLICAADHDEISLAFNQMTVDLLSDDQVRDLVRCGVRAGSDGYLCMFV